MACGDSSRLGSHAQAGEEREGVPHPLCPDVTFSKCFPAKGPVGSRRGLQGNVQKPTSLVAHELSFIKVPERARDRP